MSARKRGAERNVIGDPPGVCDHCHDPIKCGPVYYDARAPFYENKWGWFCYSCGPLLEVKLGTGLGQMYSSRTDIKLQG